MAKYIVKTGSLFLSDKETGVTSVHSKGDEVEVSDDKAKHLLELKAIQSVEDANKEKAESEDDRRAEGQQPVVQPNEVDAPTPRGRRATAPKE